MRLLGRKPWGGVGSELGKRAITLDTARCLDAKQEAGVRPGKAQGSALLQWLKRARIPSTSRLPLPSERVQIPSDKHLVLTAGMGPAG